jgi:hypothetical protein
MNLDQLISLIRQNKRHNYIYHFTDNSNFPWIHQYGLLSKAWWRRSEQNF